MAREPAWEGMLMDTDKARNCSEVSERRVASVSTGVVVSQLTAFTVAVCLLCTSALWAADTNLNSSETNNAGSSDEIPKLHPPLPQIPPSFWEEHRLAVSASAGGLALLGALGIWYLLRPKPPVVLPPVVQARQVLDNLVGQPETGAVLSKVSQAVRHYFTAAFKLPPVEFTTTEFCRTISEAGEVGPELAASVSEFLRECDERKFAPRPAQAPLNAVSQANRFIDQAESRREALAAQNHPGVRSQVGQ